MSTYIYTKTPCSVDRITLEIQQSAIVTALDHVVLFGTELSIIFKASLSSEDNTILDNLVSIHTGTPLPASIPTVTLDSSKDSDGAMISRAKITQTGWSYQLIAWEIETSKTNGITAKDHDGVDMTYFTHKMYDSSGAITTTEADCVKTVIDFEPTFDYEIVGGSAYQKTQPTENIYYYCVAVPDVPEAYGGSKVFIRNINLAFVPTSKGLDSDGRAPKKLTYSAVYHSNKLRFILNHSAGVQHKFMQVIELFRP